MMKKRFGGVTSKDLLYVGSGGRSTSGLVVQWFAAVGRGAAFATKNCLRIGPKSIMPSHTNHLETSGLELSLLRKLDLLRHWLHFGFVAKK
jgi:hypothetical protein